MTRKITAKAIKAQGGIIIDAGNGGAQLLLYNHSPAAHNEGVYGWNFDVYYVYGVTIVSGYRNRPGIQVFDLLDEYEKAAQTVLEDYDKSYEERREKVENLLRSFCDCVKQGITH